MDGLVASPATARNAEEDSPLLDLGGFTGRLERLLVLARAHQIDLAQISLPNLVEQLIAALQDASGRTSLGQLGEWVVMAAWLLLLRSRLLLSADAATPETASGEAAKLRQGLIALREVQAAARWLDTQKQLGRDVFPRGRPELVGIAPEAAHEPDVIEFLWASIALFDDDLPGPDTAASYHPVWLDLHSIGDARDRILGRLADHQVPRPLGQLLPDPPEPEAPPVSPLRRRSRWTSTFVAALELAKQGDIVVEQAVPFRLINVSRPAAALPA